MKNKELKAENPHNSGNSTKSVLADMRLSISRKKCDELYSIVDRSIMDSRIELMQYMREQKLSREVIDGIDAIMFRCNLHTAQKAVNLFKTHIG